MCAALPRAHPPSPHVCEGGYGSAVDALALFSVVKREELEPVAREVSARLRRVLETLPTLERAETPA